MSIIVDIMLIVSCMFLFSILYWQYLNLKWSDKYLQIPCGTLSLFTLVYLIIKTNFIFKIILFIIFFPVFIIAILRHQPKILKKSKIGEINRIPTYICEIKQSYSNAWYNLKDKAICFTKRLKKILTEEELKIVLEHEAGHHKRSSLINLFLRALAISSSILVFSLLILFLFFVLVLSKFGGEYIEAMVFFILIAICSSLILWVEEHEADRNAIRKYKDVEKFAIALIKIELDNFGRKFNPFVRIEIDQMKFSFEKKDYKFWNFITDFFIYFLENMATSVYDILFRKVILAHPPTKFRILYLTNFLKENEK